MCTAVKLGSIYGLLLGPILIARLFLHGEYAILFILIYYLPGSDYNAEDRRRLQQHSNFFFFFQKVKRTFWCSQTETEVL